MVDKSNLKKKTIPEQVFDFLDKKKASCTKKRIGSELKLSKASIDRACWLLRKDGKVGFVRYQSGNPAAPIVKTYWGIK